MLGARETRLNFKYGHSLPEKRAMEMIMKAIEIHYRNVVRVTIEDTTVSSVPECEF